MKRIAVAVAVALFALAIGAIPSGALAGKTFCTYCDGPFPTELVSCLHCGAPAREAA